MLLERFVCGRARSNAYLYAGEGRDALIVDAGPGAATRVVDLVAAEGLEPRALLLTHGHPDHIWTARHLADRYEIPAYLHPDDARWFLIRRKPRRLQALADGRSVTAGPFTVSVAHTPGHSRGSVCFSAGELLFAGDTIFRGAVGDAMYPGGDRRALVRSVRSKLLPLGDDVRILPGHGSETTVGAERPIWETYITAGGG
jgi:glyoxylase-like metal-dependent hydrolase (beta-lactamase superfamily II)